MIVSPRFSSNFLNFNVFHIIKLPAFSQNPKFGEAKDNRNRTFYSLLIIMLLLKYNYYTVRIYHSDWLYISGESRGAKGAFPPPLIAVVSLCFTLYFANCIANFCTFNVFALPPLEKYIDLNPPLFYIISYYNTSIEELHRSRLIVIK